VIMTNPISAIAAIGQLGAVAPTAATSTAAVPSTSGADFAKVLGSGIDAVQSSQSTANHLAVQAATGQLTDPATYTIAATQAQLMTQLMTTIESKSVDAFNQIMGMQA